MDLALNNVPWLICHKSKPINNVHNNVNSNYLVVISIIEKKNCI